MENCSDLQRASESYEVVMSGRVIELSSAGLSVQKSRGFLTVRSKRTEVERVPIDDICAVLSSSPGLTWTSSALEALANQQVPVQIMGSNYIPVSVVLPLDGHHNQSKRFRTQINASKPLQKQAWASIVRHKIAAQMAVLDSIGKPSVRLKRLEMAVRSGDTENREAQAAQIYWPLLMGKKFRRDRNASGVNTMLNYGYTVLRAAAARAIVSAGLHPSLSIYHISGGNAMALADDLMEPFRPTIDLKVFDLVARGIDHIDNARPALVDCLSAKFQMKYGEAPLTRSLLQLAQSLAESYMRKKLVLDFPQYMLPVQSTVSSDV